MNAMSPQRGIVPDPNAPISSIHERRGYITDSELTDNQLDAAEGQADQIGIPVRNVLMRVDTLNDEVAALSYFANEAWRLAFKAGEYPSADEHAFFLAPVIRRICYLSNEVSGLLSGLNIDSAADPRRQDAP